MKKRLIIPLAAMLCMSLAGCGGDGPAPEPSAADEARAGIRTESRFSPDGESSEAPRQPAASAEPKITAAPSAAAKSAGGETGGSSNSAARAENDGTAAERTDGTDENADSDISAASSSENSAENANPSGESAARPDQQPAAPEDSKNTCSFLINCSKALEYPGLSGSLRSALPQDGVLYGGSPEIKDGDSVFDLLQRITRENGIPMEFSSSPGFGSKYIEGINSLYEFDCGPNSGWVYFVNGEKPGVGCDKYEIKPGDDVRWYYTLDLGNDI